MKDEESETLEEIYEAKCDRERLATIQSQLISFSQKYLTRADCCEIAEANKKKLECLRCHLAILRGE